MCSLSLVPSQSVHVSAQRREVFTKGISHSQICLEIPYQDICVDMNFRTTHSCSYFQRLRCPSFLLLESNSYLGLCFQRYMYKTPSLPPSGHQCWEMEQLLQKLPKRFPQRCSAILSKVHSYIFDL